MLAALCFLKKMIQTHLGINQYLFHGETEGTWVKQNEVFHCISFYVAEWLCMESEQGLSMCGMSNFRQPLEGLDFVSLPCPLGLCCVKTIVAGQVHS